jgi:hypothetical protein
MPGDGEETPSCCALLFGLVEYLMTQMENMKHQCECSAPPTHIKITGKIDRIEVLRAQCGAPPEPVKRKHHPIPEEPQPRRRRTSAPP